MAGLIEELTKINEINRKEFNEEILTYSKEKLEKLEMDDICRTILTECGISKSVAPFMDFLKEEKGGFESVSRYIPQHGMKNEEILENEQMDRCYLFGFYNNCFIALNENGKVVYIDYESRMITYINKNLYTFLKIVVKFNTMMNDYFEENPDGDFFEDGLNEEIIHNFIEFITALDRDAINDDSFWAGVIEQIQDC